MSASDLPSHEPSEEEKVVLRLTADLWGAFLKIPKLRKDDVKDVCFHIHALQAIAAASFVARTSPSFFICEGPQT